MLNKFTIKIHSAISDNSCDCLLMDDITKNRKNNILMIFFRIAEQKWPASSGQSYISKDEIGQNKFFFIFGTN